jgi:hypothetical protein
MKAKASKATQEPKAKLVSHGNQQVGDIGTHHQTARQRSEEIFNATWKEKEALRAKRQQQHVPFTRIERAFVAISMTTEGEIEQDETKAKIVATELKTEMEQIDASECLKEQQLQIEALTRELEELRKDRQLCTPSVFSHHPDPVVEPPMVIRTSNISQDIPSTTPASGEISYTMSIMLEKYETLDNDSKNELLKYAISSGNENLQSRIFMLRQGKSGTSLAKLTKELIKLC